MITWSDVNVRARGLGTHLLGRTRLESFVASHDLSELARALSASDYPTGDIEASPTPRELELAIRRGAARQVKTLVRWAGERTNALAIVLEDEDRRSLRAIVRGALESAPREARLAGLIPTPTLPERALEELARLATVREIATLLAAWQHPFGAVIRGQADEQRPDPILLELEINRAFATRASRAARWGGKVLRDFVRRVIDIENSYTALILVGGHDDVDPARCFLEGGTLLDLDTFTTSTRADDVNGCGRILSRAFRGTPYADVFFTHSDELPHLEGAVLAAEIGELGRQSRVSPLGAAPILTYLLRLRAEVGDLCRVIWGITLGAPPAVITADLVTAS